MVSGKECILVDSHSLWNSSQIHGLDRKHFPTWLGNHITRERKLLTFYISSSLLCGKHCLLSGRL
jgi:hypothetical protein